MTLQELFARDGSWVQRYEAIDSAGIPVSPEDPEAVAWCLLGAIQKCYGGDDDDIIARLCHALNHYWGLGQRFKLAAWNDAERTINDVRDLVHRVGV